MIPINKLYDYKPLDRVTHPDGTRFYTSPTGDLLPSITTILGATGDKTGLLEWRNWVGNEKADKELKEAGNLGTLLHDSLENYILGVPRKQGSNLIRKMASDMADVVIREGLKDVTEVWGLETALYYKDICAGTTDIVGKYKKTPAIMDYKTSKKVKKKASIPHYFMQTGAYGLAHDEMFGTKIEMGVVFMVSRELKFEAFVIEGKEFKSYQEMFLDHVSDYHKIVR